MRLKCFEVQLCILEWGFHGFSLVFLYYVLVEGLRLNSDMCNAPDGIKSVDKVIWCGPM